MKIRHSASRRLVLAALPAVMAVPARAQTEHDRRVRRVREEAARLAREGEIKDWNLKDSLRLRPVPGVSTLTGNGDISDAHLSRLEGEIESEKRLRARLSQPPPPRPAPSYGTRGSTGNFPLPVPDRPAPPAWGRP